MSRVSEANNDARLNHFILWCKGWYVQAPINTTIYNEYVKRYHERTSFDDAKLILRLDGYELVRDNSDVLSILLNYIDELVDNGVLSGVRELRMHVWNSNVQQYMKYTKDYERAVLRTIKNLFAFNISKNDLRLRPPVYSRKLYKLGFVGPRHLGNSYKMLNHKAKAFFGDSKSE